MGKRKKPIADFFVVFDAADYWLEELAKAFADVAVGQLICVNYSGYESERVRMLTHTTLFASEQVAARSSKVKFDMWPYGSSIMVRCLRKT